MVKNSLGGVSPKSDENIVIVSVWRNSGDVTMSTDLIISPTTGKFTEMVFYPIFGVEIFIEEVVWGHCTVFCGSGGEHPGTFAVSGVNGTAVELVGHKFEIVEGGGG